MTIVIKKSGGGVAVMRLIGKASEDDCIAQWKSVNPGQYVSHATVAEESLPADRSSRGKWNLVNGAVVVDESLTPVPEAVTPRQGRAVLITNGHMAQVQGLLDAMTGIEGELARNDFASAQEWRRDWPLIEQMRVALGWTQAYVDELFVAAAKL